MRATFEGDQIRFRREVHLEIHGATGTPLTLFARDDQGHVAKAESALPLALAEKQPLILLQPKWAAKGMVDLGQSLCVTASVFPDTLPTSAPPRGRALPSW